MSNIRILSLGEVSLLLADVKHSQKLTATPLHPWIAAERNGIIICAHCTCMAGLGEACSHISALLFSTEANTQTRKNTSCTSTSCTWLVPILKKVEYAPICDIDFTTPQKRRKTIEGNLSCSLCTTSSSLKDERARNLQRRNLKCYTKSYLNAR